MKKQTSFFNRLGVYGFDKVEPLIIAALVSEDPVLLIGKSGTGKTFLLNSISEAMGLEHRHYNASLISFDDLVGFPYPNRFGTGIKFLPTPATIWNAESVLVDELSRCKPEIQNKFFSIIHERKLQGMDLAKLRYRWAAMNPFCIEDGDEQYEGSHPLDQALADRFAFIIEVPDWPQLTKQEQDAVIFPAGEGALSDDGGELSLFVNGLKKEFNLTISRPPDAVITYVRLVTTMMTEAGFRISPRRARLLSRNIIALKCVAAKMGFDSSPKAQHDLFKLAFSWSLPHRAYKSEVPDHIIDSVHAEAARLSFSDNRTARWISEFQLTPSLADRVSRLFDDEISMDTKSLAVVQMLSKESLARKAIFSFCLYPLLSERDLLNAEAVNEMVKIAKEVYNVVGKIEWKEGFSSKNTGHPGWSECLKTLHRMSNDKSERKHRAKQLFLYLLTRNERIADPDLLEKELNKCFMQAKKFASEILN